MRDCRADVVGSMLRPAYLIQARKYHSEGKLGDAEFKETEDRAVNECIGIQERAGVDVIADGEMRRSVFTSQLQQACGGFARVSNRVDWFAADGTAQHTDVGIGVVEKIRRNRHLSAEEFTYLRAKTRRCTKITIPSPTMFAFYWVPGVSNTAYRNPKAYLADVTAIMKDEVAELARLGARYIQIDAPEFGMLIDPHQRAWFAKKGFEPEALIYDGIDMINAMIDGHSGITFGLHICRGNNASQYMAKGGYSRIAGMVFPRTQAQRLLLEYDDERSGDFAPLKDVPEDKVVVLGLVTTKTPRQETLGELCARITEAARYVSLDRLAISTQCGFASVSRGNTIDFETQRKKLHLVARVAREVWKSQVEDSDDMGSQS